MISNGIEKMPTKPSELPSTSKRLDVIKMSKHLDCTFGNIFLNVSNLMQVLEAPVSYRNLVFIIMAGEEYWMGLENIFRITNERDYTLRITMKNFQSSKKLTATYKNFKLTENVRSKIRKR
jgi:hypothetical protein